MTKFLMQRVPGRFRRPLLFLIAALVLLLAVVGTVSAWEYTNSSKFCGTTCHTMPPEYVAYEISPHARVKCVECHLGRDVVTVIFGRKAGDILHLVKFATKQYEVPIHAKSMRPARDSCEKCHWPEKFSEDSVRVIKHFLDDENNTERDNYLVMRTGGGTRREGRGYGIHWHIENQVWYIATDELKQDIPWVRVIDQEGGVTDYIDLEANLSREFIETAEKRRMDCIDCHNRVSHLFRSAEEAIDRALTLKQIDKRIPFIKKKGMEVLSHNYANMDEAMRAINDLISYYRSTYPDFYASNKRTIQTAIEVLKGIYREIVFPTMEVSWKTYPNNLGHKDWPGCFRCHDGKHLSQQGTSIRLHCNICHSIPIAVKEGQPIPKVSLSEEEQPASHLTTNWMAEHRFAANGVCEQCHGTYEFGSDDSSFCTNSNCHGTKWKWVGLDATYPHPVKLEGKHAELTCIKCHGRVREPKYVCRNCHQRPHTFGNDDCTHCHTPLGWKESAARVVAASPLVPHPLAERTDCLLCHTEGSLNPFPADHRGRTNDVCLTCHRRTGS